MRRPVAADQSGARPPHAKELTPAKSFSDICLTCSTATCRAARLAPPMPFSLIKMVRVVLAVALAFWVAGAGCLLGCEGMMTVAASESNAVTHHATSDPNLVVSGEACASAKSHDCCAKRNHSAQPKAQPAAKQVATLVETDPASSAMSDCPLAMSRTVVVAKKGARETNSATIVANANLSTQNLIEQPAPLISQVRLPNRGHTYLRCCSFLI